MAREMDNSDVDKLFVNIADRADAAANLARSLWMAIGSIDDDAQRAALRELASLLSDEIGFVGGMVKERRKARS